MSDPIKDSGPVHVGKMKITDGERATPQGARSRSGQHSGDMGRNAIADSSELLNVGWFTFEEIKSLETQRATDMMLQVLDRYLKADRPPERIFYSRAIRGEFKMLQFP